MNDEGPGAVVCRRETPAEMQTPEMLAAQEILARNLRSWRRQHRLERKVAAAQLGVAISTWCQWETARRFPTGDYLTMLGRYMRTPLRCLMCARPQKRPDCPIPASTP